MTHWSDNLPPDACADAVAWARTQPSLEAAWAECRRGNWMLWLLGRCDADRRLLVKAAALCAEPAAALAGENEGLCLAVIQTCIAWSEGEATDEELEAAAAATRAAWARAAAEAAATARVWAAWAAEAAAEAAAAATRAAWAAWAAWAAAAWAAVSLAHSADIVRGVFPEPPALTPRAEPTPGRSRPSSEQ